MVVAVLRQMLRTQFPELQESPAKVIPEVMDSTGTLRFRVLVVVVAPAELV